MMTPMRYHPTRADGSFARPRSGFGFEQVMERPDYRRFPDWFARQTRLPQS